jgi:hypothetical protein
VDNDERRPFDVGEHVLGSDEPAEAHGEMIVHFKQAAPPMASLPWARYYVITSYIQDFNKTRTANVVAKVGALYGKREQQKSGG